MNTGKNLAISVLIAALLVPQTALAVSPTWASQEKRESLWDSFEPQQQTTQSQSQGVLELSAFDLNMTTYLSESLVPDQAAVIELQLANPTMYVDGTPQSIDSNENLTPTATNGRTMVTIRTIVESMGGDID